jgi:signal transduction histidine kinase
MRLWPRSLLGRVLLVVCGALALAHALTLLIVVRERAEQGLSMMQAYVGRDVAASVAVLDSLPPAERAAWLPRLARANYRYAWMPTAVATSPTHHPLAEPVRQAVAAALGPERVGPVGEAEADGHAVLTLPLRLQDGSGLLLTLVPPGPMVSGTTLALLLAQMLTLIAGAWLVVRVAVRPLQGLAHTAEAIQPDGPETGLVPNAATLPTEVAHASLALQTLQARVAAHVQERTQLLAAISHDLQTPITRMRLRVERIDDTETRHRLHDDLDGMSRLVAEGLAYARSTHAGQEAPVAVDLAALLDTLVCDAQDAGHDVRLQLEVTALPAQQTRVQALRRLVGNLLDNAVAFGAGQPVTVTLSAGGGVTITVDDAGPGIPEAELQAVMRPYHRLDTSRNRDSGDRGGTGLGLAIAQQLSLALGAELSLHNRPEGGLRARLTWPAATP